MSPDVYAEKVSVNMNAATLSAIDLLVDGGYYSNRSDFINQAVRGALQQQQSTVDRLIEGRQTTAKRTDSQWFIGVCGMTSREIAEMAAAGEAIEMTGYGVFHLPEDVNRSQLYQVVKAVSVRGKVVAPKDVKQHYGLK